LAWLVRQWTPPFGIREFKSLELQLRAFSFLRRCNSPLFRWPYQCPLHGPHAPSGKLWTPTLILEWRPRIGTKDDFDRTESEFFNDTAPPLAKMITLDDARVGSFNRDLICDRSFGLQPECSQFLIEPALQGRLFHFYSLLIPFVVFEACCTALVGHSRPSDNGETLSRFACNRSATRCKCC